MNSFVNLPASGAGPGAAVDVSAMGQTKTLVVGGPVDGNINVEYSEDGTSWAPIASFQAPGTKTVDVAAMFMRANVTSGGGGANVDVGSSDAGSSAIQVPTPPDGGAGASVDVSGLPLFKTVVVSSFEGTVNIEISEDGTSWGTVMTFHGAGGKSGSFYGQFARVVSKGGAPTVWMGGANAGAGDGSPPFEVVQKVIYVRTTGSDTSGNGTLANPYATVQHANRFLPNIAAPGVSYVVDTDFDETFAPDYKFPVLQSTREGGLYPGSPYPYFEPFMAGYTWRAVPKLAVLSPASDAVIAPADGAMVSSDPITKLVTITLGVARASWGADALKGKLFLRTVGNFTASCAIYGSDTTHLYLCDDNAFNGGADGALVFADPSERYQVVTPGATWTGAVGVEEFVAINCLACNSPSFQGLHFASANPDVPAMAVADSSYPHFMLCVIDGLFGTNAPQEFGTRGCVIKNVIDMEPGAFITDRCLLTGFDGAGSYLNLLGQTILFRRTVFDDTVPSIATGNFFGGIPNNGTNFFDCLFQGSTADAILMDGGRWNLENVEINDSIGNAITALNGAFALLVNVGGSGNTGFGVQASDASQVRVDAATVANAPTGTAGDTQSGSLAAKTWANVAAGLAYDIPANAVDATVATGTRIYQR